MNNLFSIFVITFLLLSCEADSSTEKDNLVDQFAEHNKHLEYEVELIDGLSFPKWIEGVWQNTAESNTNNFVTYAFTEDQLTIRQGLHFQGAEKFIQSYKEYNISENTTDSTYLIKLTKNERSLEYEFKLQTVEWSDEKVLTYSIVEDGELTRDHFTSIQLVLNKI